VLAATTKACSATLILPCYHFITFLLFCRDRPHGGAKEGFQPFASANSVTFCMRDCALTA
jgi:hypothetical protein